MDLTAIKKAVGNEWKDIKVGENTNSSFRGKVVLDLDIVVTRGPDIPYTPTAEISPIALLALALQMSGFQGKNITDKVVAAANQLLSANPEPIPESLKLTEEAIERVKKEVQSKLSKKNRAGPTNVKGVIRISELQELKDGKYEKVQVNE